MRTRLLVFALLLPLGCAALGDVLRTVDHLYNGPVGTLARECVRGALADEEIGSCLLRPSTWAEPPSVETRARVGALGRSWVEAHDKAAALAESEPDSLRARSAARRFARIDARLTSEIGQ